MTPKRMMVAAAAIGVFSVAERAQAQWWGEQSASYYAAPYGTSPACTGRGSRYSFYNPMQGYGVSQYETPYAPNRAAPITGYAFRSLYGNGYGSYRPLRRQEYDHTFRRSGRIGVDVFD